VSIEFVANQIQEKARRAVSGGRTRAGPDHPFDPIGMANFERNSDSWRKRLPLRTIAVTQQYLIIGSLIRPRERCWEVTDDNPNRTNAVVKA